MYDTIGVTPVTVFRYSSFSRWASRPTESRQNRTVCLAALGDSALLEFPLLECRRPHEVSSSTCHSMVALPSAPPPFLHFSAYSHTRRSSERLLSQAGSQRKPEACFWRSHAPRTDTTPLFFHTNRAGFINGDDDIIVKKGRGGVHRRRQERALVVSLSNLGRE